MNNIEKLKFYLKRILKKNITIREMTYASIKNDYNIIDAGAHVGNDSLELSKHTRGTIHSFEPVSNVYNQLNENTRHQNNIVTYKLAVSDVCGDTTINVSTGGSDASSSLLKPKEHYNTNPEVEFIHQETVKILTFDQWMIDYNINRIDFLWLDLQGMEFQVLKASPKLMSMVKVIFTEISTIELYEGQGLYGQLKEWLLSQGFELMKEDLNAGFTGDALFVRN